MPIMKRRLIYPFKRNLPVQLLLTFSQLTTLRKSILGLFSREKRSLYWVSIMSLIWKRPIGENISSRNSGFSLVEVIVASLIFTITIAGVLSSIAILKPPAEFSERGVDAADYAQSILENLRAKVDVRTWNDPNDGTLTSLSPGAHTGPAVVISGVTYTATYTVTSDATGGRQVDMTVTW